MDDADVDSDAALLCAVSSQMRRAAREKIQGTAARPRHPGPMELRGYATSPNARSQAIPLFDPQQVQRCLGFSCRPASGTH